MLVSGIAIPASQFAIRWVWERRQHSKIASLRKDILEVQTFISQIELASGGEPARQSKAAAQHDLTVLLEELNRASRPFSETHPALKKLLAVMLVYIPPYPIGWFIRLFFYGTVAAFISMIIDLFSPQPSDDGWWWWLIAAAIVTLVNVWGQAADRITGPITKRSWWKRLSLLYKPVSKTAMIFQIAFWADVPLAIKAVLEDLDTERDLFGVLYPTGLLALLWWSALHFDRKQALPFNSSHPERQVSAARGRVIN